MTFQEKKQSVLIEISFRYSKNTNPDEALTERLIGTFFYLAQK
jgi:hypothetical protein